MAECGKSSKPEIINFCCNSYSYSKWKSLMNQMIAVFVGNLILLQFGVSMGMPTIVNGQLMSDKRQSNGDFTLSKVEASWYGSLLLIFHPVGSLLSSYIQDRYGRKACFVLVCPPHFIGWMLLCTANSSTMLYLSCMSLGVAMGLSEAPILTYIGESVESRFRSVLSSLSNFSSMIGLFLSYLLASILPWRVLASLFLPLPVVVFFMTTLIIPESPIWLLSKNEIKEAKKSLRWLRGFADDQLIQEEIVNMLQFAQGENAEEVVIDSKAKRSFIDKVKQNWQIITDESVLRPFILLNIIFFFGTINGMIPVKPYLLNVISIIKGKSRLPISEKLELVIIGSCTICGALLNMVTIKRIGKRHLLIVCVIISAVCQFCIGLYAMEFMRAVIINAWVPYLLFCTISFVSGFGILPIPWILLGEIFPMKGRGTVSGITTAINFTTGFILIKTYFSVVDAFTLPWTIIAYSIIGALGIPYIYYKFPDTDNKTLQQIQQCFQK